MSRSSHTCLRRCPTHSAKTTACQTGHAHHLNSTSFQNTHATSSSAKQLVALEVGIPPGADWSSISQLCGLSPAPPCEPDSDLVSELYDKISQRTSPFSPLRLHGLGHRAPPNPSADHMLYKQFLSSRLSSSHSLLTTLIYATPCSLQTLARVSSESISRTPHPTIEVALSRWHTTFMGASGVSLRAPRASDPGLYFHYLTCLTNERLARCQLSSRLVTAVTARGSTRLRRGADRGCMHARCT